MEATDKNNFATRVQHRLIDKGWSVQGLADALARPRSSVSRAIHGNKFPLLKKEVAKKLRIALP